MFLSARFRHLKKACLLISRSSRRSRQYVDVLSITPSGHPLFYSVRNHYLLSHLPSPSLPQNLLLGPDYGSSLGNSSLRHSLHQYPEPHVSGSIRSTVPLDPARSVVDQRLRLYAVGENGILFFGGSKIVWHPGRENGSLFRGTRHRVGSSSLLFRNILTIAQGPSLSKSPEG